MSTHYETNPICKRCKHRHIMHYLGALHVDDRGLPHAVPCIECYIDASRNKDTVGTAGACRGYKDA